MIRRSQPYKVAAETFNAWRAAVRHDCWHNQHRTGDLMSAARRDPDSEEPSQTTAITVQHRRFLKDHAAGALSRRDAGFFTEQILLSAEWLWIIAVGLWGLLIAGWNPVSSLLLLFAGFWVRNIGELIKLRMARSQVELWSRLYNEDQEVWALSSALMRQRERYSRASVGYVASTGVFLDWLLTGLCSLGLWRYLQHHGVDVLALTTAEQNFSTVLVLGLGVQLLMTFAVVIQHSVGSGRARPVAMRAGALGPGLFVVSLAALVATNGMNAEPMAAARIILLCFYAGLGLLLPMHMLGLVLIWREVRWLRTRQAEAMPS